MKRLANAAMAALNNGYLVTMLFLLHGLLLTDYLAIRSGFHTLFGDLGDGRLNHIIFLEHS